METTVGRPRFNPAGRMKKVSVTIDPDLMAWAETACGPSKEFSSISHAVNVGLSMLKDRKKH